MKKYVIGDIHGGLKALKQVLSKTPHKKNDTLIFLGDYVDGWSESPQVIDYLIHLSQIQNCIFIRGNHDDLLLQYLKTKKLNSEWFKHGGESTLNAYKLLSKNKIDEHIHFLENLQNYYLDDNNKLFVHAGFTNIKGVDFEYFPELLYWDRTLWECACALNPNIKESSPLFPNRLKIYKEIYIGHTPVTRINKTIPTKMHNVWNLDTAAAFMGTISVLDTDTKEFWQSNSVQSFYPNEKGRN